MARSSVGLTAFNGGEISTELEGRTDLAKYNQSARSLVNFLPHPEGGLFRRPGFRFVTEAFDSSKITRLIPFIFSTDQAYVLEFSDQRIRIFRDEGIVVSPDNAIEAGAATVDTFTEEFIIEDHGYYHNQLVRLDSSESPEDLPDPLVEGMDYFVRLPQTRNFTDGDVVAANNEIDIMSHGYTDRMGPFEIVCTGGASNTGGVYPAGLRGPRALDGTEYYIRLTGVGTPLDSFALSLTPGGAAVPIGNAGGAMSNYSIRPKASYKRNKFRLATTTTSGVINLTDVGTGTHTVLPQPRHATLNQTTQALEIASPYLDTELFQIQFTQSADVLYLVHPNHPPRKLSRLGDTMWRLDDIDFIDGPFMAENPTLTTATAVAPLTGLSTVNFSSTTGINGGAGFSSADIGRLFRWNARVVALPGNWGWGYIVSVPSTTSIEVEWQNPSDGGGAIASKGWRLGFFRTGSYPRAVAFTEQRLCFGGESETPETLHMSKTSDFQTFSPTGQKPLNTQFITAPDDQNLLDDVLDDNAIDYTIGSDQVNAILWFVAGRSLVIGTAGAIIPVRAQSASDAITPTNIRLTPSVVTGGNLVQAITVQNRMIFASRNNRSLSALRFAFDSDDFVADDLTLLADHIFGTGASATTGIVEMAYQAERHSSLWMPRKDGTLLGLTYQPDQQVFAWHRHVLGGSFSGGIAVVESVTSIPSPNATYDQVWVVVKRTINGATKRYVEFMLPEWTTGLTALTTTSPAEPEMIFVDSSPLPYVGVATTSITGLDHLEGEVVQVMADAGAHPDRTVTSGAITLQQAHTEVAVGLGYISDWESMNLAIPDPEGSSMGKRRRINRVMLRLLDTIGGKIGSTPALLDPVVIRGGSDPMDIGPPPFTGIHQMAFRGGHAREGRIFVRQDQPLPFNMLAITALAEGGQR